MTEPGTDLGDGLESDGSADEGAPEPVEPVELIESEEPPTGQPHPEE